MRRAAILAALVCWTGCTQRPHAELVVVVMTDIAVPAGINRLEIEVHDARVPVDEPQVFDLEVSASDFPATLTLTSAGAAPRDITVTVTGLLGREPVVSERAITSFVAGPSRALVIWLADACRPEVRACAAGESCQPDGCVSERRDGSTLPLTEDVLNGGVSDGGVSDGGLVGDSSVDDAGCVPTEEVCDSVDNDCDGITDETEGNADVQVDGEGTHGHCGRCFNACDRCVAGDCSGVRDIEAVAGESCFVESMLSATGTLSCGPGDSLDLLRSSMLRFEAGPFVTTGGAALFCYISSVNREVYCIGDDLPNEAVPRCTCTDSSCLDCPYRIRDIMTDPIASVTDLAVGARHACAVIGGGVYCWGNNERGQLGRRESVVIALRAIEVEAAGASDFAQVVAGARFTCAREQGGDRRVFCWGANEQGSLGRDSTIRLNDEPYPVVHDDAVETVLTDVIDVSCAGGGADPTDRTSGHCCAALSNGDVECWGSTGYGQLDGAVTPEPRGAPRALSRPSEMAGVRDVEVGPSVSCAVTVDDEVWCWGDASAVLQLSGGDFHGPARISFPGDIAIRDISLSAGVADHGDVAHVFALARAWSGEVYCWGPNEGFQCTGTTADVFTPTLVTP